MICQTAVLNGWRIWSTDIKKAYLKGGVLSRTAYLEPMTGLNLPMTKLWRLKKTLYGLCDSGDYWCEDLCSYLKDNMDMQPCGLECAQFTKNLRKGAIQ